MSTNADREWLKNEVLRHPRAELTDFTRDHYRTMIVSVQDEEAAEELIRAADDVRYAVSRPDGRRLILEAP